MAMLQLERNGALFGVHGLVRPKSAWHSRHCQRRLFTSTIRRSIRFCGKMPDEHGPPAFCFCAHQPVCRFFLMCW